MRKETYNLYIMIKPSNKKVDIEFGTYDNVSGITFIGYPHTQKVRKSNNFSLWEQIHQGIKKGTNNYHGDKLY